MPRFEYKLGTWQDCGSMNSARACLLRSHAATTGGQRKLTYFMYFPWRLVNAALLIVTLVFLLKTTFLLGINENKADCHQFRVVRFLKLTILETSIR